MTGMITVKAAKKLRKVIKSLCYNCHRFVILAIPLPSWRLNFF